MQITRLPGLSLLPILIYHFLTNQQESTRKGQVVSKGSIQNKPPAARAEPPTHHDQTTHLAPPISFKSTAANEIKLLRKTIRLFPPRIHGLAAGEMFFIPCDDGQPATARNCSNQ
jgi:hypothetical protein